MIGLAILTATLVFIPIYIMGCEHVIGRFLDWRERRQTAALFDHALPMADKLANEATAFLQALRDAGDRS